MLAVIAVCASGAIGAAVLVITASMLSSRISRHEDYIIDSEFNREQDGLVSPASQAPNHRTSAKAVLLFV